VRTAAHQNALATTIRALAAESCSACLLDASGIFLFVNNAWDHHALANGGAPACLGTSLIGTSWLQHIRGEEVRHRHALLLERAVRSRGPRPVIQVSESNTPTTAALVSTRLEPVLHGAEPCAVSVLHRVVRVRPIEEVYELVHRPAEAYRDERGAIVQCSCCRRVNNPRELEEWDFVPDLVATPLRTEQGVCPLCAELHYGALDAI
jgi:hypothetical protein